MKALFDPNGKLMTGIGRVGDHFLLSLLWLFCSLPIVTMGAASAAMCQVSFQILDGEECHLLRDYFAAFKRNWKLGTVLHLAVLAVLAVFALDVYFYVELAAANDVFGSPVLGMVFLIALMLALCLIWLYPYAVCYGGGFLRTVKMAFLLGMSNLGWTALMLALDAALVVGSFFLTFLAPFLPGLITLVNTLFLRRILRKYGRVPEKETE